MYQKKKFYSFLIIILYNYSISSNSCQAQDSLMKSLKEVTITATRTEKLIFNTGRSVSVITADDIRESNYSTLGELLSFETGVYVPGSGQTPGSVQTIFLSGANSNQTALFIDGIRITDPSSVNNTIDLSEISIHDIEKIEIIRGSHSTLYGSSAIGGVINITTKNPLAQGFHSRGGISTGTFGLNTSVLNPFADVSYKLNNGLYITAMVDYSDVKGLNATVDTITDPSIFKTTDNDDWKKLNTGVGIGFNDLKNQVKVNYKYTNSETDIDRSAFRDDDNYRLDYKRSTLSAAFSRVLKHKMKISLSGGLSQNERHAVNDSSINSFSADFDHMFTEDTYTGFNSNLDFIIEKETKHIKFLAGLSGAREEMTTKNYIYSASFPGFVYENLDSLADPKPEARTSSIYFQMDVKGTLLSKKLSNLNFVAGARYDYHQLFNEHFSFELNPSWQFSDKGLMYISYSTGYNAPSLYQLYSKSKYIPWDGSVQNDVTQGNLNLKPERSASLEFGIKYRLNNAGILSFSAFNRHMKDQIEYAYLWDGAISIGELGSDFSRDDYRGDRYLNAGSGNTYGMELNLRYMLTKKLSVAAGLSVIQGELNYTISPEEKKALNNTHVQLYNNGVFLTSRTRNEPGLIRRPNTFKGEIIYSPLDKFKIRSVVRYVDIREDVFYDTQIKPQGALNTVSVDEYFLVDLLFTYKLGQHLSLSAFLDNISNEKYSEIRGFSTRGRGLYFKITYQL
ncbi:MAG TPA: TonB-dependent receptor [Bacteroidia bacterium]|nr:TonB-dependent receptor [Bacteroidia bacterium]HNS11205.1 TonB-dependent receptor [Bacteroidia bacterium]